MRASKQTAAHVTHVDEADVTELVEHYRRVKPVIEAQAGVKFSLLPFFIKALIDGAQAAPRSSTPASTRTRQEILLKRYYNIGIAVDTPEGLIVPVLKDADRKDMVTLAARGGRPGRARARSAG